MKLVNCPSCKGKNKKCSSCLGLGKVLDINKFLFAWQTKLSRLFIYTLSFWNYIKSVIDSLIYIATVLGIVLSLFLVYKNGDNFGDILKFFVNCSLGAQIFWITLLLCLFLLYKLSKWRAGEKRINAVKILEAESKSQKVQALEKYFSSAAQEVIYSTWLIAQSKKQNAGSTHLLWALLRKKEISAIFDKLDIDIKKLDEKLEIYFQTRISASSQTKILDVLAEILYFSFMETLLNGSDYISPRELLVGLASCQNVGREILFDLEITSQKIKNTIEWLNLQQAMKKYWGKLQASASHKPKGPVNKAYTSIATPHLDDFSDDLTFLARQGAIEPSVGSEKNLDKIFDALSGHKPGVVLVGEPGTGKTTVIHFLAQLMASEDVPTYFQDKRLIQVSIPKLIAGASGPGEIEARLFAVLKEVATSKNLILFIDRIEDLVGLGTESSESLDLAGVLAQELEKNYFTLLATTYPENYEKYISRSALNSSLIKIEIEEMEINNSIRALGIKGLLLEEEFGVKFTYQAIESAVLLSKKYLPRKYLPSKAVDVLEQTAKDFIALPKTERKEKISTEHVASAVAKLSKIPTEKVSQQESEQLLHLEDRIHHQVVDQNEAVSLVAEALRRARAQLGSDKRPIANFLFMGPTGVGKTQVARTLADVYFGGEKNIIRLDMSEYSGANGLARLIGAPGLPGYLTSQIKDKPFSLVLLDEFEKASAEVHNLFLQVMEDGRLTDSAGSTYNFTNTILIATSNAASEFVQAAVRKKKSLEQIRKILIEEELIKYLKPELINRFDAVVVFKPLKIKEVQQIAQLMLDELGNNLQSKGIDFSYSAQTLIDLAQTGFDPKYGARPLRRVIQDKIENRLAEMLLTSQVKRRDKIIIKNLNDIQIKKARHF